MNFQFYCPHGHLLQADSTSAGSIISCPICATQFIIPAPPVQPVTAVVVPAVTPPPVQPPVQPAAQPAAQPEAKQTESAATAENDLNFAAKGQRKSVKAANLDSLLGNAETSTPAAPDEDDPLANMTRRKFRKPGAKQATFSTEETKEMLNTATKRKKKAQELDQFRIPCPNGHVLDVDKEMLGERVQCPVCHAVYDLQLENSLEYIKEKKEEEELEEARLGKIWIQRAIIAGILVLIFLAMLILTS
ncbi:MAG: hypothetical protein K6C40_13275 [Thermoguttaceae bacterium]|nr:hypothetical protein [Thermoguttaceae bacterium]